MLNADIFRLGFIFGNPDGTGPKWNGKGKCYEGNRVCTVYVSLCLTLTFSDWVLFWETGTGLVLSGMGKCCEGNRVCTV
jgi:hypothetical protein